MHNVKKDNELYSALVCALMHNISVCDGCKKCGEDGIEVRTMLVEELAKYMDQPLPWK